MTEGASRRDVIKLMAGATLPLAGCATSEEAAIAKMTLSDDYKPFDDKFMFSSGNIKHPVYKDGEGPGVLLMHELPGMTPQFWRFAAWLRDDGFTVYAPDLLSDTLEHPSVPSLGGNLARTCMSREIHLFARNSSSPVTVWLRSLAVKIHEDCGGPGVGAIGMCMTGNFALSLVLEEKVIAPVASQPAMPVDFWAKKSHGALHMSAEEKKALQERTDVDVMALRFRGDPTCRAERFKAIEELVGGKRFRKIVLPDCAQNPDGNTKPHAVLTKDLIDEQGSLTIEARDSVLAFMREKLQSA